MANSVLKMYFPCNEEWLEAYTGGGVTYSRWRFKAWAPLQRGDQGWCEPGRWGRRSEDEGRTTGVLGMVAGG
jgi:hypothetical protein